MHAWCLRKSEDSIGSPVPGVRDGCEPPNLGSLREQPVLLLLRPLSIPHYSPCSMTLYIALLSGAFGLRVVIWNFQHTWYKQWQTLRSCDGNSEEELMMAWKNFSVIWRRFLWFSSRLSEGSNLSQRKGKTKHTWPLKQNHPHKTFDPHWNTKNLLWWGWGGWAVITPGAWLTLISVFTRRQVTAWAWGQPGL